MSFLSVITGFDWTKVLPVLKWVAIAVVAYLVFDTVKDGIKDGMEALKESGRQEIRLASSEAVNDALHRQNELEREAREAADLRAKEVAADFASFRDQKQAQDRAFDGHDLRKLLNAKPGLIERLANRATAQRFDEFEKVYDGS